jgi:hypothetical protein
MRAEILAASFMKAVAFPVSSQRFPIVRLQDLLGGCCQTDANSSRFRQVRRSQAAQSARHSARAAVRCSLKVSAREAPFGVEEVAD